VCAEQYEFGAPEALALELSRMERARGMAIEAPAVRP
jgi:sulfur-oxidizing protein SoxA